VYAWSSKAGENPVAAEYIIMERLTGVQLSSVWKALPMDKQAQVLKTLAAYQKAWISTSFKQYGSLYYAQDVPQQPGQPNFSYLNQDGGETEDQRFAIGPTVHRQSIDYGRAQVNFDRGPCKSNFVFLSDSLSLLTLREGDTVEDYCKAIGDREMACVKAVQSLPKPPLTIVGRYVPTRAKKLAALQSYLKLIKFLLPIDPLITTSHIWHSDLHGENIFVNPNQPTEIIGIIDWQSVGLNPLFESSPQPAILDYDGPPLDGLERPEEPKDLDQLDPVQRASAFDRYMEMTLASYYRNLIYYTNKRLFRVIEFQDTISYDLLVYARNILIDGEAIYQERVADELKKAWNTLPGVQALNDPPYPFHFSREELATIRKDYEGMSDGIICTGQIQEEMGDLFPGDKCISHEKYDDAKKSLMAYKEKVLTEFARNEEERAAVMAWWPFD
jgi:hypothetical protein